MCVSASTRSRHSRARRALQRQAAGEADEAIGRAEQRVDVGDRREALGASADCPIRTSASAARRWTSGLDILQRRRRRSAGRPSTPGRRRRTPPRRGRRRPASRISVGEQRRPAAPGRAAAACRPPGRDRRRAPRDRAPASRARSPTPSPRSALALLDRGVAPARKRLRLPHDREQPASAWRVAGCRAACSDTR